tara:strand:- start:3516 stop:4772 length:1257 start_codon:yes stop_codon:yes gene_type:complete
MKLFLSFLFLTFTINLFAIDRSVNPNLSSGNGTTLFKTISSAVSASVNGDRILIDAGTYNEPTLTLDKSLTLLPQTAGSKVNYNGNLVVAGFPGMKLEILGFNLGIYSVSSDTISGGSAAYRAKVSFIDCAMTNLSLDQDYYELNCIKSAMTGNTTFRFGNFVVSKTNDLYVFDEPNKNLTTEKILIVADTIINRLEYRNDNYKVVLCNNLLKDLIFTKWNTLSDVSNNICNNDFISNCKIMLPSNAPYWNVKFNNNLFDGPFSFASSRPNYAPDPGWNGTDCCQCGPLAGNLGFICLGFSNSSSYFPNPNDQGFFEWTYNGIDLPCIIPSGSQPLVLTKIIGPTGSIVDAGNPSHDYYDIDLTINDRGRTGGPYSILNYNPSFNPSNGKAFIFDIEMPTDLFPGQDVDIKAKGYHRN